MEPVVQISGHDQCWEVLTAGPGFHLGLQSDSQIENHVSHLGRTKLKIDCQVLSRVRISFSMIFEKKLTPEFPYGLNPGPVLSPIGSRVFHKVK
jgi:hypothetical protein